MRIGIDARELAGHMTGVGRFLGSLLREWSQSSVAGQHEFVLYAPEPIGVALDARRFRTREVSGATGTWWEQMRLPGAIAGDALDVFFAPAYTAPLRMKVPVVVVIHDLSYVAHPEWFRLREGIRRRWLTERTAIQARSIITVSEFSRGEIIDRLGIPPIAFTRSCQESSQLSVMPAPQFRPSGVVRRVPFQSPARAGPHSRRGHAGARKAELMKFCHMARWRLSVVSFSQRVATLLSWLMREPESDRGFLSGSSGRRCALSSPCASSRDDVQKLDERVS